jgi:O-antigen/teichoic acid export membrane protein
MISANDSAPVKVAKGAALIFAGMICARLLNYAYRVLLARSGGADEFGLLFLGITTIAVTGTIVSFGFGLGVARFVPYYLGEKDESRVRGVLRFSIRTALLGGCLGGLLLWKTGPLIAGLLKSPGLEEVLEICALCLPFYTVGRLLVKAVVAFQKIGYRVAVHQVLNPVVRLLLTIVLLAAGMGVAGAMWAYLAAEILSCIALFWLLERRVFSVFTGKSSKKSSRIDLRPYLAYCLPLLLSGIVDLLMNYTDVFMSGYFLDTAQVGIYGAAVTLVSLAALGNELLNPMFLSIITREYAAGNNTQVIASYNNNNRWCMYFTLPPSVLLILFSAPLMVLLWGVDFAGGAAALAILTVGRTVYYMAHTSGFILSMHGATRFILFTNLTCSLLNVALNLWLIPRMQITGAALATSISLCLVGLIYIYGAHRLHRGEGMRLLDLRILGAIVLPLAVVLPAAFFRHLGWAGMVMAGLIFAALFIFGLWILKAFSAEDRLIWRRLIERLKGERA